jgi:peptidoglycan/xylan/chitin deacetylase (PgdA/CDA1 family)
MPLLLPFALLFSFLTFSQKNQICFTIDDLPVVNYGISDTSFQKLIVSKLVSSFNKNKIPAIGFVNEKKLYIDDRLNPFQIKLLNNWIENGYELGNHTFSHIDYNTCNLNEYASNILQGEINTKKILEQNNQTLRYFRHPYLHVGNTKEKADSLSEFLIKSKYIVAPVTFDTDDYTFASAYQKAFSNKDTATQNQIGKDYLLHIKHKLMYYEKQSNTLFDRNIRHVLLIHANLLNADYVDSIAQLFTEKSYTFIKLEDALEDELYDTEITVYGKWGISWIDKWALSKGFKKEFFKDEPVIPSYIGTYH